MRRHIAALVAALLLLPAVAHAQSTTATDPNKPVGVSDLDATQAGYRLKGRDVRAIADRVAKVRAERRKYKGSYSGVYTKGPGRWQVSYFTRDKPPKEIGQVYVADATGRVTEAWTDYQVPWTMARGYAGAFGRKVNDPAVWIGLTVVFLLAFFDPRRPFRILHLDLLVLAGFGVSVAYFNDANIDTSVPLLYPLLAYVLARMLWIGLRTRPEGDSREPLRMILPATWMAVALIFLVGFRVGLNVTDSNVIDVGYAGVIGADKIVHGEPIYGNFPKDNEHGDTYGPVNYLTYVPFTQLLGWGGSWDDLPAAHAAAIVFDLLCILLCFLLGRRVRGPNLGIALAFAWAAFPFTLYSLACNANDALVAVFLLGALLAAASAPWRGVFTALGGLTKFATLGVGPLFATHGFERSRLRGLVAFSGAFAATAAIVLLPVVINGDSLSTMYDRTIAYQAERNAPFSIWGLYELDTLQYLWQGLAVLLAVGVALVRRRPDVIGLAALAAAVLIALQLGVTYWFYLYIVWFFPLVMLALLGRYAEPDPA